MKRILYLTLIAATAVLLGSCTKMSTKVDKYIEGTWSGTRYDYKVFYDNKLTISESGTLNAYNPKSNYDTVIEITPKGHDCFWIEAWEYSVSGDTWDTLFADIYDLKDDDYLAPTFYSGTRNPDIYILNLTKDRMEVVLDFRSYSFDSDDNVSYDRFYMRMNMSRYDQR